MLLYLGRTLRSKKWRGQNGKTLRYINLRAMKKTLVVWVNIGGDDATWVYVGIDYNKPFFLGPYIKPQVFGKSPAGKGRSQLVKWEKR